VALLSEADRLTVSARLAVITHPVTLLFFSQTIGAPDSALVARQVIDEVASMNELVTVRELSLLIERDEAAAFGIDHIPSVVLLRGDADTRMRFVGAPAGYEFMSLVDAVILAGTGDSGLASASRALAATVTAPFDIKVFVTPTCPHCPRAVTLAHRLAVESPHITATCVEASEFLDLSRRYRVTGVPKTVANDSIEVLGALPEDAFVRALLQPAGEAPPSDAAPPDATA